MSDVFISYAREDCDFARGLNDALEAGGREVWVDFEGIPPSAEWMLEIERAIEAADAFVFVISPDSAASPVCRQEVEYALARSKRVLPILLRKVPEESLLRDVAKIHWIDFAADFDAGLALLIEALETDLDHVRMHTRLTAAAAEWERRGEEPGLLPRVAALRRYEQWLESAAQAEPPPSPLQARFIVAGRRAARRRRRWVIGSVGVAAAIVATLGALFYLQRRLTAQQTETKEQLQYIAQTRQALTEWRAGRVALARQLLDSQLPDVVGSDRREFVWHFTDRVSRERVHESELNFPYRVFVVDGGATLFKQGIRTGILEWDLAGDRERASYDGEGARGLTVSEDGRRAAWILEDAVRLLDRGTGAVRTLVPAERSFDTRDVDLSGDASKLVMMLRQRRGFSGAVAVLWLPVDRPEEIAEVGSLELSRGTAVRWIPRRPWIALASNRTRVTILHQEDRIVRAMELPVEVVAIAASPDGNWLAARGEEGPVHVWNLETEAAYRIGDTGECMGRSQLIDFGPQSDTVLSCDGSAVVEWRLPGGGETRRWRGLEGKVAAMNLSPDGALLAAASQVRLDPPSEFHGRVRVWSADGDQRFRRFDLGPIDPDYGPVIAFDGSGTALAVASVEAGVVDLVSGETRASLYAGNPLVTLRFAADGSLLAGATTEWDEQFDYRKEVFVWDARTGEELAAPAIDLDFVSDFAFSADLETLALQGVRTVVDDAGDLEWNTTETWDLSVEPPRRIDRHAIELDRVGSLLLGVDGEFAIVRRSSDRQGLEFDALDFTPREPVAARGRLCGRMISAPRSGRWAWPDGRRVVLWDPVTGGTTDLFGHNSLVEGIAFSPDERSLASVSADGELKLWDTATGLERGTFFYGEPLEWVCFGPDGLSLTTVNREGEVVRWEAGA